MKIELKQVISLLAEGKVKRKDSVVALNLGDFGELNFQVTDDDIEAYADQSELEATQAEEEVLQAENAAERAKTLRARADRVKKIRPKKA